MKRLPKLSVILLKKLPENSRSVIVRPPEADDRTIQDLLKKLDSPIKPALDSDRGSGNDELFK